MRLDRVVALALIKTEGMDDAARTRLRCEARAVARLGTHPHLVTVFDVGEEAGQPYLVCEHLAGGALDTRLQAAPHRLPVGEALRIATEVCRGLEHVHACGLLHRDVKPANVWLTADGTAKLGDFGLGLADDRSRLAAEEMMVGSVAYLPPEQALGQPLDARSDLYAVGALLYELVSGLRPFSDEGAVTVLSQHLRAAPVAPSWHAPAVPGALDRLILELLANAPTERPASAAAVREALSAIAAELDAPRQPTATPTPRPHDGLVGDGFVGRAREMESLRTSLDLAVSGRGRLVLLAGEPGIGKTRTAAELARWARLHGVAVLWGRCHEGEGAPAYWPWVQAIRAHARARDTATLRAELGPGADDVAQLVSEIRTRFPQLQAPPALLPAEARFRLFDSVTIFLKNLATREPLLLILDDLHWADAPSLLLLEFLAREMAAARLLVLGTYRDVEVGPEHSLFRTLGELAREPVTQRLALRGFDAADIERYVESTTDAATRADLVASLLRETNGNPFFVGEVVRLLVAESGLEGLRQRTIGTLPVPEPVREVIGRRLGRLSGECNEALRLASVIGRDFDFNLLARVSEGPRERVLAALEEATHARVVAPVPGSLAGYRFAHALVRETLYEALPRARRALLHQRIGEAVEHLFGAESPRQVASLAHHFFEAVRASGDARKSIAYSRHAGALADQSLAFEEAVRHYERALQVLDASPDAGGDRDRLALLRNLGASCLKCEVSAERLTATLERAVELAERIGDPELQASTALEFHKSITQSARAETGVTVPALERALAALAPTDSTLAVRLLTALVREHRPSARRRLHLAEAARAMADRIGDLGARRAGLAAMHAALLGPEWTDERLPIGVELVEVAEKLGIDDNTWLAFQDRVYDLCEAGDMVALDALVERALDSIERTHNVWLRAYAPLWRGMRALHEGRLEDAERFALELKAFGRRTRHPSFASAAATHVWEVLRARGRLAEIDSSVREPPLRNGSLESGLHAARSAIFAVHQLEMDREREARQSFERLARNDFREIEMGWYFLPALLHAASVANRLRDRDRAAILYERLRPHAGRSVVLGYGVVCLGSASMPLGLLATTLERFDDAARHFEDAIAFDGRTGGRLPLARTRHAYAVMLHARGWKEDAGKLQEQLGEAVRAFEEIGMPKDLERALALRHYAEAPGRRDLAASVEIAARSLFREAAASVAPEEAGACVFRLEGDYWTVTHEGAVCRLRDTTGLRYLAHLLCHPGREIHVLDLMRAVTGCAVEADTGSAQGAAGPMLDERAKAAYRSRLADLREELREAESFHDPGRADRAQQEIERLTEQLAAAVGLGGRDRVVGADAERARSAITHGIKGALRRITQRVPSLGRALAPCIRTGTFCAYTPDPARPLHWEL